MIDLRIDAAEHGPLFDGRAQAAVDAFLEDAKDEVARQADADVHLYMNAFFKQPTPYYETQVSVENVNADRVVHDRGIIYGPWLAGVGSRNRTTRFKGYAHWRLALQDGRRKMPQLVAVVLRRHIGRMR